MTRARIYRRIIRRETHASRSVAATLVVLLAAAAACWVGVEIVMHLLGLQPLVAAPHMMAQFLAGQAAVSQTQLTVIGAAALAAGLIALWFAVAPGRRSRHGQVRERVAVLIDDGALASSAATSVAEALDVPRSHVRVSVGKSSIEAEVTPVSGFDVATEQGERTLRAEVEAAELQPALRARLRVREQGVVGA